MKKITAGKVGTKTKPSSDLLDVEKAPDFQAVADQYRLWSYYCTNGTLRLHVQPTQSDTLLITVDRNLGNRN